MKFQHIISIIISIITVFVTNIAFADNSNSSAQISECFESKVRMSFLARDGYKYTPTQSCELKGIMNYSEYNHQFTKEGKAKADILVQAMILSGECDKFGEITIRLGRQTESSGSMEFVSVDEEGFASESLSSSVYENEFSSSVALQSIQKISMNIMPVVIVKGRTLKTVSPVAIKAVQGAKRQSISSHQKTTLITSDLSEVASFQIDAWENKTSDCSTNEEFVERISLKSALSI